MGVFKEAEGGGNDDRSNVVPFERPTDPGEPLFNSTERAEIRRMLRQFARIGVGCPTARREAGD